MRIFRQKMFKEMHNIENNRRLCDIGVTIIDAPCGSGKTTWAIQQMAADEKRPYLYCTPFLDEITRIREACGKYRFAEPKPFEGTKIEDFNRLISLGGCVAVTHSTFLNATRETVDILRESGYTLILDEVLDVIVDFNEVPSVKGQQRQSMTKKDAGMLLEKNMIRVGDDRKVHWIDRDYDPESKFYEVQRLAKLGRLYLARERLLVSMFPPEVFQDMPDISVLTYLFEGSLLKPYFDLFHIGYEKKSLEKDDSGTYHTIPYSDWADLEFRKKCSELVHVYKGKLNRNGRTLTRYWYRSADGDSIKQLKNDTGEFFNRVVCEAKASNGDIMWTALKDYEGRLSGKGYTRVRMMTRQEKDLPEGERKRAENSLRCFVPCNARATNDLGSRWALAYLCNLFPNLMIDGLLRDCGVAVDRDAYAISGLIQWICRSRLRNGGWVELYLPSKRMRDLFAQWLDCGGSTSTEGG